MIGRFLFLLMAGMLASCSTIKKTEDKRVDIGRGAFLELKEPKDILPEVQLVQVLTFDHQGKKRSSQAVLTSKDNVLSIVALLPLGGEAFRVEYSRGEIRAKMPSMMGSGFDLKFALADIILIYADESRLRNWLSAGVEIVDQKNERKILQQGEELVRIHYDKSERLDAAIRFEHLARGYQIQITPLSRRSL